MKRAAAITGSGFIGLRTKARDSGRGVSSGVSKSPGDDGGAAAIFPASWLVFTSPGYEPSLFMFFD
jgi:hypothetical protein